MAADASTYTVRAADAADTVAATELVQRAYGHHVERIGRRPAPMNADYGRAIADGTVWVVDLDDRIAGITVVHEASDHVLIENVAVDPALQRGGIGSVLMEFAEMRARALGLGEVRLYTNEQMTENLAYYARRGYTEVERRSDAGFRRVFFAKALD